MAKEKSEKRRSLTVTIKNSTYDNLMNLKKTNTKLNVSSIVNMAIDELLSGQCTPLKEDDQVLIEESMFLELINVSTLRTMQKLKKENKYRQISLGKELRFVVFTKDEFREFLIKNIFHGFLDKDKEDEQ